MAARLSQITARSGARRAAGEAAAAPSPPAGARPGGGVPGRSPGVLAAATPIPGESPRRRRGGAGSRRGRPGCGSTGSARTPEDSASESVGPGRPAGGADRHDESGAVAPVPLAAAAAEQCRRRAAAALAPGPSDPRRPRPVSRLMIRRVRRAAARALRRQARPLASGTSVAAALAAHQTVAAWRRALSAAEPRTKAAAAAAAAASGVFQVLLASGTLAARPWRCAGKFQRA